MPASPLAPGIHLWVWPLPAGGERARAVSALSAAAKRARALGAVGLIVQDGLYAPHWVRDSYRGLHAAAKAEGVQLTVGLGLDGNEGHRNNIGAVTGTILAALEAAPAVMLNWEGRWGDDRADKERALFVVDEVIRQCPGAERRCVDAPWWAPVSVRRVRKGRTYLAPTHPGAPTREFGRLCEHRYVQAYGANVAGSPDGMSTKMLAWSRHETQYPSLGIAADKVHPSYQGYERSVTDQVNTLCDLAPGEAACVWHLRALDPAAVLALQCRAALAAAGYTGPGAPERFQRAQGIPGPRQWGPLATRALGLTVPPEGTIKRW